MKLGFVSGPFRADSAWEIECNIRRAEEAALEIWRMGAAVICPHTNTRFFQGAADDSVWLKGDLEILKRCDFVYQLPGSENSEGTNMEAGCASSLGIPIFYNLVAVRAWLSNAV